MPSHRWRTWSFLLSVTTACASEPAAQPPAAPGESPPAAPGACVEELHLSDFGVAERYERSYRDRLLIDETYEVIDPRLSQYTYATVESHRRTFEHDADGRVVRETYDAGPDGLVDRDDRSRYDDAGRLVELTHAGAAFGPEVERWTYDDAGRLLELVEEYDGGTWRERHELTSDGRPLVDEWTWSGALDRRVDFTYDAAGRLAARDEVDIDGALDRTYQTTFSQGARGLESAVARSDFEGDGIVDRENRITYGPLELPTEITEDQPLDGHPDVITRLAYDDAGRTIDELSISAYESPDTIGYHTSRTFSADGLLMTETQHPSRWSAATRVETRSYDDHGLLVRVHTVEDGASVADERFSYDAAGRRLLHEASHAGGAVDLRETWAYDDAGNLLRYGLDAHGDGAEESVRTFDYGCFRDASLAR